MRVHKSDTMMTSIILFMLSIAVTLPNCHAYGCDMLRRRQSCCSRVMNKLFSSPEGTDDTEAEVEMVTGSIENKESFEKIIETANRSNQIVGLTSAMLGIGLFLFAQVQPSTISGIALLHAMERDSESLQTAVCNGKPTIIDFYADWCESCKAMAPTMRGIELQYRDDVNFVTINGASSSNADLVDRFKVDGIPHLTFLGKDGEVKTALVGAVPKKIMKEQMEAFTKGSDLPYYGLTPSEEDSLSRFPLLEISKSCPIAEASQGMAVTEPVAYELKAQAKQPEKVYISEELRALLKSKSVLDVLNGS